ncbi:MAG: hypothetical protein FWD57_13885, partial [Polyangiaceae bacterium]|nr:hypothetical protein [Polyangiaceae bacterium]
TDRALDRSSEDMSDFPSDFPLEQLSDQEFAHMSGPFALHRMPATVSGVCLVAMDRGVVRYLVDEVASRESTVLVLAKGITHRAGHLQGGWDSRGARELSYTRLRVLGGHSLLEIRAFGNDVGDCPRLLARVGHPVIGDRKWGVGRTNDYFLHRHWLERPFVHIARVQMSRGGVGLDLRSELAPDLAAVRASLEA